MGKISRQKLPKGGSRGRTGLEGARAPRAKSRVPARAPIQRQRDRDYDKFRALAEKVAALEKALENREGFASEGEAKATAKELKLLRAKLMLKEQKHGGGK